MGLGQCPTCKKLPVFTCKCFRQDSRCEAGHEWHLCPQHYEVALGPANHQSGECTCRDEHKYDALLRKNTGVE